MTCKKFVIAREAVMRQMKTLGINSIKYKKIKNLQCLYFMI